MSKDILNSHMTRRKASLRIAQGVAALVVGISGTGVAGFKSYEKHKQIGEIERNIRADYYNPTDTELENANHVVGQYHETSKYLAEQGKVETVFEHLNPQEIEGAYQTLEAEVIFEREIYLQTEITREARENWLMTGVFGGFSSWIGVQLIRNKPLFTNLKNK